MDTTSFGIGWEGRVVEGRFPLLEKLEGAGDRCSFFTVLGGMQEAIIRVIPASAVEAEACLAQWKFAIDLSHPHLSKILAAGRCMIDSHELIYVVTEAFDGSLSKVIRNESIREERIKEIFRPILSGLTYLHKKGVVHGHINPSSILFANAIPKLSVADLLIANSVKRGIVNPGVYDAPEVLQNSVTAAADSWSVGMVICESMTQAPLTILSAEEVKSQVVETLPSSFREIVQRCLEIDPLRRCNIREILERLDESESVATSAMRVPAQLSLALNAEPQERVSKVAVVEEPDAQPREQMSKRAVVDEPVALVSPNEAEPEGAAEQVVFSRSFERFEEAHLKRSRWVPYAVLIVAVLALVAVLLVRGRNSKVSPALESESIAPAQQEPAAEKPSTVPESQSTAPNGQSAVTAPPAADQAQPQNEPESKPLVEEKQAEVAPESGSQSASVPVPTPAPDLPKTPPPAVRTSPRIEANVSAKENVEGRVVKRVLPNVSPGAAAGLRNLVEVETRVSVNKEGKVSDAAFVSPGPGNYFARLAQRAALSWEFTPPIENGVSQRSVWKLRFTFTRSKTEAVATRE